MYFKSTKIAARLYLFLAVIITTIPAFATLHVDYYNYRSPRDGENFRIAIIRNDRNYSSEHDPKKIRGEAVARSLAEHAHDWVKELFKKEYPDFTDEDFKGLNDQLAVDDPRITRIVAMRADDPMQIVGSLVLVYDDLKRELPYDAAMGKYQRPTIDFRNFTEYDMMTWGFSTTRQLTGGVVQLMEFVVDPSARGDLNAVLHFASEYELTGHIPDLPEVSVPHWRLPKGTTRQDFLGKHTPVRQFDSAFWVLPEEYILFCADRMVDYYLRLGFEIIERRGKLIGMKISRQNFIKISNESPFFKRSYKHLDSLGLEMDTFGDGRPEGRAVIYPPGADPDRHGENLKQRFARVGREAMAKRRCERIFGVQRD